MALIGNYSVILKSPGKWFSGGGIADMRANFNGPSQSRGVYYGDKHGGFSKLSAKPRGYRPPYDWMIPQVSGDLGSDTQIAGTVVLAANLAGGLYGVAPLTGSGSIIADLRGIASIIAALSGSGAVTSADLRGVANVLAALSGSGTVTSADLRGVGNVVAALSGSGTITNAELALIVSAVASLTGSGSLSANATGAGIIASSVSGSGALTADIIGALALTASLGGTGNVIGTLQALASIVANIIGSGSVSANMNATGNISATISPFTPLSPESLAASVWNAVAANFNNPNTMGQKVNSAAAAGDPWQTVLPGAYAPGQAGNIIGTLPAPDNATIQILRKMLTNRLEESAGNPGHLILYDDDSVTVLKIWELRDSSGGAVVETPGSPSKRGKAT